VIETFQTHFIFQRNNNFNFGFLAKFPSQKNTVANESENLAKVTSSRNEKQISLQIGIMG
jgi:hypothetical protein